MDARGVRGRRAGELSMERAGVVAPPEPASGLKSSAASCSGRCSCIFLVALESLPQNSADGNFSTSPSGPAHTRDKQESAVFNKPPHALCTHKPSFRTHV